MATKKAAAKRDAKQAASDQQQQALKAHQRSLVQTRMDEVYGVKKSGKKSGLSGGMSSGVNEKGHLIWEGWVELVFYQISIAFDGQNRYSCSWTILSNYGYYIPDVHIVCLVV